MWGFIQNEVHDRRISELASDGLEGFGTSGTYHIHARPFTPSSAAARGNSREVELSRAAQPDADLKQESGRRSTVPSKRS